MRRATLIGLVLIVALAWIPVEVHAGFAKIEQSWFSDQDNGTFASTSGSSSKYMFTGVDVLFTTFTGGNWELDVTAYAAKKPGIKDNFDVGVPWSINSGNGTINLFAESGPVKGSGFTADAQFPFLSDPLVASDPVFGKNNKQRWVSVSYSGHSNLDWGDTSYLFQATQPGGPALAPTVSNFSAQAVPLPPAVWTGLATLVLGFGFGLWQRKCATANV